MAVMAVSKDIKLDGDDLSKGGVEHIDTVLPQSAEDELSAWECIRKNPKICLWIAWANSKTTTTSFRHENLT